MRSLFHFITRLTSRWLPQTRLTSIKAIRFALATAILLLFFHILAPSYQQPNTTLIPTRLTQGQTTIDAQSTPASARSAPSEEIRGVWITNVASNVLFAPWGIPRALKQLSDLHFNTVYPVVWNRGKTFYHSPTLKRLTGQTMAPSMTLTHPSEDPLAEMVRVGHSQGMRVIPWFEYGFMVPLQSKLAREHPHWLTNRYGGSHLLYEPTLTGSAQQKQSLLDRLLSPLLKSGAPKALGWLNPLHPDVQAMMLDLVEEVITRYDVEGIQFDDHFSLPAAFGYDPYTTALYQLDHHGQSPPENSDDPEWIRWRADQLSKFVDILHDRIKASCSTCLLSISPNPAKFAYRFHLQDWRTWVSNDWVDELVVQIYRDDIDSFDAELAKETLQSAMDQIPVSIGILTGTWRRPISFEQIKQQVIRSRDYHFSGVTFFYWDTLWSYFTPESPQRRRQNFRELLG